MVLTKPGFQFPRSIVRLMVLTGLLLLQPWSQITDAQRRTNRRRPSATRQKTVRDYSIFLHEHHRKDAKGQELACAGCHTIPALNFPDEIAGARKPTSKGFPYHDSCFGCHQKEVYRGDRPAICTICHTRVSPGATAQDVYTKFPKEGEISRRQFPAYFPHGGKHLQVMWTQAEPAPTSKASCAKCHATDPRAPVAIQSFTPATGAFKKSPAAPSGHAFCFTCHGEDNDPTAQNCAGCHRTNTAYRDLFKRPTLFASDGFKDWPSNWPRRISLKFSHLSSDHKDKLCIVCHTNILKPDPLESPDVPIASCGPQCHFGDEVRPALNVVTELKKEEQDTASGANNNSASAKGTHSCTGCHLEVIGGMPPACSHYLAVGKHAKPGDYSQSMQEAIARCEQMR